MKPPMILMMLAEEASIISIIKGSFLLFGASSLAESTGILVGPTSRVHAPEADLRRSRSHARAGDLDVESTKLHLRALYFLFNVTATLHSTSWC